MQSFLLRHYTFKPRSLLTYGLYQRSTTNVEDETVSWVTVVTASAIGYSDERSPISTNGERRSIWQEAYRHVTMHLINVQPRALWFCRRSV